MAKLHWFNPQNDLALAANVSHFTPPKNAFELSVAGQVLPLWYGDDGDFVCSSSVSVEWFNDIVRLFDIKTRLYDGYSNVEACMPWGWSLDALSHFRHSLRDVSCLPSLEQLEQLRLLSHRRQTITVINQLKELLPFITLNVPVECSTVDECINAIRRFESKAYVKLPYSSSGRGILCVSDWDKKMICEKVDGMINRQGSVLIEKALDKIVDFAMLFSVHGGIVDFIGYSAFYNENGSAYSGNLIMPDDVIRSQYLGKYVDAGSLSLIEEQMVNVLGRVLDADYDGYLGVDMMVYDDCGTPRIAPCIEINLRMTMGVVAHRLGRKFLPNGLNGKLRVDYMRSEPLEPPVVVNGKLVEGEISLVPPHPKFSITLGVL